MELLLRPLLRLFAWAVSRGGEPRMEAGGRLTVFPQRPGMLVFAVAGLVYAGTMLAVQGNRLLHGDRHVFVWWQLAAGAIMGCSGVQLLTQRLWLDEDGLHRKHGFGRDKLIRWETFSHYEVYQSKEAGKATYFFRSGPQGLSGEEVTVAVPEMSYDTARLLEEVGRRVRLEERPRVKRHWWGG